MLHVHNGKYLYDSRRKKNHHHRRRSARGQLLMKLLSSRPYQIERGQQIHRLSLYCRYYLLPPVVVVVVVVRIRKWCWQHRTTLNPAKLRAACCPQAMETLLPFPACSYEAKEPTVCLLARWWVIVFVLRRLIKHDEQNSNSFPTTSTLTRSTN